MRCRLSQLLLILLPAWSGPVLAVDADLFSLDDFVDPRTLGYDFDRDKEEGFSRGNYLVLTNLSLGAAIDYQERELFTDENAGFGQFDINYYYNALQLGYRYHRFSTFVDDEVSRERRKYSFGFYKQLGEDRPVSRIQLTWEESDVEDGDVDEIGLNMDIASDISWLNLLGGVSLSKRYIPDARDEYRLLLRYVIDPEGWPVSLRLSFGGAKLDGEWDWDITKAAVRYYIPIANTYNELHLYYAFTYRPERDGISEKTNNEIGGFINIPLVFTKGSSLALPEDRRK